MAMSVFVKIKAVLESLSTSELKLASFVLDSPDAVKDMNSQVLARAAGVSQSSVVKFAQKLGYRGYPALKFAVLEALNTDTPNPLLKGQITQADSYQEMADKLVNSKIAVLHETRQLNEIVVFERAVELIKGARRILISGVGGSALVGKDFSYRLHQLGIHAMAEHDGRAQLGIAAALGESDVVIAISHSGTSRDVLSAVSKAHNNGARIIAMTKYGSTPISRLAHVQLYSVAEEHALCLSSTMARTSQEMVIDMLCMALTQVVHQS